MTSHPLRLAVVYEQTEHGWITATIPAVPGRSAPDTTGATHATTRSTRCARRSRALSTLQKAPHARM